jgi:hypothetical protein
MLSSDSTTGKRLLAQRRGSDTAGAEPRRLSVAA